MRTAYWAWVPASLAAALLIGCGQPTLTVRHRLPPDLPQAAGIAAVRPGRVQVTPSLEGPFEEVLTEMLTKRLSGEALAAAPGHPPVEAVLLTACVDTLARMIQPAELERTLPLRGSLVGGAGRANRAAADGKLTEAAERLRTCLQSHPRHGDLWFNLGAVEEAAGRLDQAEEAYRKAVEVRKGRDAPAAAGLRRVQRILRLRQWSREATARAAGP